MDLQPGYPLLLPAGRGNEDVSSRWPVQPGDAVEESRLAGAVGADEGDDVSLLHLKGRAVERPQTAEVHGQFLDVHGGGGFRYGHGSSLLY